MRRIALMSAPVLAAILAGCESGQKELTPLPAPILTTRKPAPPPPAPAPAPIAKPRIVEPDTAGWLPPRGIQRGKWKTIVVHHSTSEKDTPEGMDAWHRKRGWENGLGYHFVIGNGVGYPDGSVYVGPRWKKQLNGAHCATKKSGYFFGQWRPSGFFNDNGIGICLVGNMNNHPPTPRQMEALGRLVNWLRSQTGIPLDQVYGHGHVTKATECPGRYLSLTRLRQSLSSMSASAE